MHALLALALVAGTLASTAHVASHAAGDALAAAHRAAHEAAHAEGHHGAGHRAHAVGETDASEPGEGCLAYHLFCAAKVALATLPVAVARPAAPERRAGPVGARPIGRAPLAPAIRGPPALS